MLSWLYYLLLLSLLLAGLCLNLVSLPGNWLMLVGLVFYDWWTGWRVHWVWLAALVGIAVAAEVLEFFAAGAGAKKAGGTLWGSVGALIGGIAGAIFLSGLVPIGPLSTLVGMILGTFLGAMGAESLSGARLTQSAAVGVGAAKGRLYGTLLKLASGCLILLLALIAAMPVGGRWKRLTPIAPTPRLPIRP